MDPNAQDNLDRWTYLHTIYPNGVCPSNCQCMGDSWNIMCENLETDIERFHEQINEWTAVESSTRPLVPTKIYMMNVAARSYWNYREERENSAVDVQVNRNVFRTDLPLPPCVHNRMSENIDAILRDLQEVFDNQVERN